MLKLNKSSQIRICHAELIVQTENLLKLNRNLFDMLLKPEEKGMSYNEAIFKLKGVIEDLKCLLEQVQNIEY